MPTPMNKDRFRDQSQSRAVGVLLPTGEDAQRAQRIESTHYVEGYAARFEPYVLWDDPDGPIYEVFDRDCFVGADMGDVILQYDHCGKVYARTGNGSLVVGVDDGGLFMAADLSRTDAARQLYDEIKQGMITKMSWRFSCGEFDYDEKTRTITHHTVKKVWDVSAVSIPANNDTEINARSWADGVIDLARRSDRELEERRQRLRIKTFVLLKEEHNAHH